MADQKPCPNCGHCPTCGKSDTVRFVPYYVPSYPYYQYGGPVHPNTVWSTNFTGGSNTLTNTEV